MELGQDNEPLIFDKYTDQHEMIANAYHIFPQVGIGITQVIHTEDQDIQAAGYIALYDELHMDRPVLGFIPRSCIDYLITALTKIRDEVTLDAEDVQITTHGKLPNVDN